MIPGELNRLQKEIECPVCKRKLPLTQALSNAGYYLGFVCAKCGPISRETSYFKDFTAAREALRKVKEGKTIPEERN